MITKRHNRTARLLSIMLVFSLLLLSTASSQDVKVKINAPATVMAKEQFRVDYVVESNTKVDEPIVFKNMEGFEILYGPSLSNSSSVTFKEGKRLTTYVSTSTYYLEAPKDGKFSLPNAEIKMNGKKYKSGIFKIDVKSAEKITGGIDAFVKTIVSRSWVGFSDTLTLRYKLYTTKEIGRIGNSEFPYIYDFYSTNITPSRQRFTEEVVNGRTYKVADLRVLILQPRKEGRIIIPEGKVTVEYLTPTGRKVRDMWGEIYDETIRSSKILKIDSTIIRVQNLKEI